MRFNQREILFISSGLIVLIFLAVFFLVVEPLSDGRDKLKSINSRMSEDLAEMMHLASEYKELAAAKTQIKNEVKARDKNFAPFSFLETLARQAGLGQSIESITPVASASDDNEKMAEFELRLKGIGLSQLVRFLYSIESSNKVLFVNTLHLKPRYMTPDTIDVTLRVSTPASSS